MLAEVSNVDSLCIELYTAEDKCMFLCLTGHLSVARTEASLITIQPTILGSPGKACDVMALNEIQQEEYRRLWSGPGYSTDPFHRLYIRYRGRR